MKIIFAGTPEFAAVALRRLCDANWDVCLVLTQPDRPAGRGMQLHPSAVKLEALSRGIAVCQPRGLRLEGKLAPDAALARTAIQAVRADVMVVAAYGLILPQWLLDLMRVPTPDGKAGLGCLNIHASLLPRWRGAAPIHRAIEAGDTRTGVCIMQMDAGLDSGEIVTCGEVPIRQQGQHADTTGSLHDQLAELGATLLLRTLESARHGRLQSRPQAREGVCHAPKVLKSQARVDWTRSAVEIERAIRAFDPAPGAWTEYGDAVLKLWRADVVVAPSAHNASAGTVLAAHGAGIEVACGDGVLTLRELQRAGGKRLDAGAFVRGTALRVGMRLGATAAAR